MSFVAVVVSATASLMFGEVSVLLVSVCVPPTVTTLAAFVPAFVTRRSPVPTVRIPVECVAIQSLFAILMTAPDARKRSENESDVVPSAAPSFVVGVIPVVIVGDVSTHAEAVEAPVNVLAASVRASVAEVVGNVIVVESVPESVMELFIVSVFEAAPNASVPLFVLSVRVRPPLFTPVPP